MLKNNTSNIRSFASNTQAIIPIIVHHYYPHSSDYSQHQIVINKSLSIAQPLIVFIEKASHDCISLEDFFVLLDKKLLEEQAYIEEILQFKDTFCGEFDRLYEGVSDKNLLMFIRNQRQRIIDCVFDSLKFEKRQIITKFYDNMMSGYDDEAMKKFEKIVCNALWKPLLTPLPLGLTEKIKNAVEEIKYEKIEKNIEKIASRLILFVQEHFNNNQIKLSEFVDAKKLKSVLMGLSNTRKICSVDIDDINQDKLKVIGEFQTCIKNIAVSLESTDFDFKIFDFDFVFNHLSYTIPIDTNTVNKASKNIPRVLKSFAQYFTNVTNTELEMITINFLNLNSLRMLTLDFSGFCNNNTIGDAGMLSIVHLISQNKQLKSLNLNLQGGCSTITDTGLTRLSVAMKELLALIHFKLTIGGENIFGEGLDALSKSLQAVNKIKQLYLDFSDASITTDSIDQLAASISKMNQMRYLDLNFSNDIFTREKNTANNNSMTLFAQAISESLNLNHLGLNFGGGKNEITDYGIMQLGRAIAKSASIHQLILIFWADEGGKNVVTDKGLEELAQSIAHSKSMQQLDLDFSGGRNEITDKGIEKLSQSIAHFINIQLFGLDFSGGKNKITDKGIKKLSESIAHFKDIQRLCLNFSAGYNAVSDTGIEELSCSIARFTSLTDLKLQFDHGNHLISDKGMQALARALKNTNNISTLEFSVAYGNSITDASMDSLADALKQMSSSLSIQLCFCSRTSPKVSARGESIITNARTYNNIYFARNE